MRPLAPIIAALRPPAARPPLPEREAEPLVRYWRIRQLYSTFAGYAVFYFVRKNMPVALPLMESGLGVTKAQLGIFLSLQDVVYGVSKFANGFVADRANARVFMALGLLLSAAMNLLFGLSSGLVTLGVLWVLNGWFQGMGFPPCARILSNWYGANERGLFWGLWNTSHQVGAALIAIGAGFLGQQLGWRAIFVVPAAFSALVALVLFERLRDTPESLGLPPIDAAARLDEGAGAGEFRKVLRERVFSNPAIWLICVANFFVYSVRIALLNWLPSYLSQAGGLPLAWAAAGLVVFEGAGLLGSLAAGLVSDWAGGKRAAVCAVYMTLLAAVLAELWTLTAPSPPQVLALVFAAGFLVYGPQFLVGLLAADLATRRAAATATGLTGAFGYASGVVTGFGIGWLVDRFGWSGGFAALLGCAVAGAVPFLLCWNAVAPEREARLRVEI